MGRVPGEGSERATEEMQFYPVLLSFQLLVEISEMTNLIVYSESGDDFLKKYIFWIKQKTRFLASFLLGKGFTFVGLGVTLLTSLIDMSQRKCM